MDDYQKREELKKVYPGREGWADKVDRMSAAQVTAIYLRMISEGKLR